MKNTILLKIVALLSILLSGCNDISAVKTVANRTPIELKNATQADIDDIANKLVINYRVITNIPSEKCQKELANGACFEVALTFTADQAINAQGWSIHFSQISPIQSFESESFDLVHVNGDLHKISLKDSFQGFKQGETKTLVFRALFWSLSEYDALPNYIVSAPETVARVIESTRSKIDPETGLEILPYVTAFNDQLNQFKRSADDATQWLSSEQLFIRNQALGETLLAVDNVIIPTPKSIRYDLNHRQLDLSSGLAVSFGNVAKTSVNAALSRLARFGFKQDANGIPLKLSISDNSQKPIGSYQLAISDSEIIVVGVDESGVFNGLQSLASLTKLGSLHLPMLAIIDEPLFEFRGLMVDVARNFHSKAFILNLLEQMSAYKLNKLHLHLGDDEGWRLEIPSLPELTTIGAYRCFDLADSSCLNAQLGAGVDKSSPVNGFYSVSDYQEILIAANERHIQVIPSLDMPGHSRAAVKAMAARSKKYVIAEQPTSAQQFTLSDPEDQTAYSSVQFYHDNTINVCLESSYAFVSEVMMQVKKMHAAAGQPLTRYHIGADETAGAWILSPACQNFVANNSQGVQHMSELGAYFIERVAKILTDLDIETAGWSDGLSHTRQENMPAIVQANAWDVLAWGGHDNVHQLANRNWQVVVSSPDVLYFDFPYEADPKEHGYYWASRHTNTEKVFQFMPENLPVHAEFWLDRQDKAYQADDTKSVLEAERQFFGIQGQLWSENTRDDNMAEHKIFPRLFALAERAWHRADWAVPYNYQGDIYNQTSAYFTDQLRSKRDLQWRQFANTLGQKELAKLELFDINYRLPTVGAKIMNGYLHANIAFPGVNIEYQKDGIWRPYQSPVPVKQATAVRSRNINGNRVGRTTMTKFVQ